MTVFPELSPFPFIMAIPFAVTMMALHWILFRPLLQYLDERAKTIQGARDEAKSLTTQIEDRLHDVEQRLKAARADAAAVRKEARSRATSAADGILGEARTAAEATVSEATAQIAEQHAAASKTLAESTESLSAEIVTSVLGRAVA